MLLSICIPTHHGRLKELQEALDSVLSQLSADSKDEVEICVSDNASADGTAELMQRYMQQYGEQIRYHRNEVNRGFPFNIIKLVEMARGAYCWHLSSDDAIAHGGVATVLQLLVEHPDTAGVTVNKIHLDRHLAEEIVPEQEPLEAFLPQHPERMHMYTSADEIHLNCSMSFTFMSGNIVRREYWMEVVAEKGFEHIESFWYYPHLYILGNVVARHPNWIWCPEQLIKYRLDNDTSLDYLGHKLHHHQIKVMEGVSKVWAALFGKKSSLYKTLLYKHYLYSWVPAHIRFIKFRPNYTYRDDLPTLVGYIKYLYVLPEFWMRSFPVLITPYGVYKLRGKLRIGTKLRAIRGRIKILLGKSA